MVCVRSRASLELFGGYIHINVGKEKVSYNVMGVEDRAWGGRGENPPAAAADSVLEMGTM